MTKAASEENPFSAKAPVPRLVPPPKIRRRPVHIVATIAAILLGAAIAAWGWTATTTSEAVVAARTTIPRGAVITADDLTTTQISGDNTLKVIPGDEVDELVGKRAALDIAAGGLLTPEMATDDNMPPAGQSIVGISLTPAQVPAITPRSGDKVRLVATTGEGGETSSGTPLTTSAEVIDSSTDEVSGNTVVNVLVPYADAAVLADRASTGNIALVVDPLER
ncbi:SAF domain-containing protein [Nocardioides sp. NPDC006303]|uniref:SAF domain-containing protein n=1 Tax=Nocardioides sp. NPDC006303 TaxID=3156747 RepID=UPI0033AA51CA